MSAYELRIYQVGPGYMGVVRDIFRTLVLPLMPEYGMEGVGYWATPDEATLYWLVRHETLEGIAADWDRFQADPRWTEGLPALVQGRPTVTARQSVPLLEAFGPGARP